MNYHQDNTITLVTVCDDHYAVLLAALIKSIEQNYRGNALLDFYIVSDGIKPATRKKLLDSFSNTNMKFRFLEMNDVIPTGTKLPLDRSTYPLNIYLRLFIPYFVPAEVKKVIYLDVDMIVMEDIRRLWSVDLEGNIIAAVQDERLLTVDNSWGGIKNYQDLGLKNDTKYFNTGLIVFDNAMWRKEKIDEKVLQCIDENKKFANYPDQYGLNVILANRWKELDAKWNYFATNDFKYPYIIHFVSRKPIYKTYSSNKDYQNVFYSYLNLTEWKDFKTIDESRRYWKKINNIISKVKKAL